MKENTPLKKQKEIQKSIINKHCVFQKGKFEADLLQYFFSFDHAGCQC